MSDAPYGPIDPNSQHQMWSRWIFGIQAAKKRPSVVEVADNGRRYIAKHFGSVGRVRCDERNGYYCIQAELEGPPAHDPALREAIRADFVRQFVRRGFGARAVLSRFDVAILCGDTQDGKPPDQLIVMPAWEIQSKLGAPSHGHR